MVVYVNTATTLPRRRKNAGATKKVAAVLQQAEVELDDFCNKEKQRKIKEEFTARMIIQPLTHTPQSQDWVFFFMTRL